MQRNTVAAACLFWALAGNAGAVGNLADVSVYDRAEHRALPVYHHEGRHYVVGGPGNEYQIRVHNRSGAEILAVVSVDGVNAVSGETANWHQTGYVLAPHQALDVKGWRKSLQRVAAFFFTEHQNSYAARTGRPDNVGVIGVALFRKKAEPEQRIDPSPMRREAPAGDADGESPSPPSAEAGPAPGRERSADSAAGARHLPSLSPGEKPASLGTGHGRSMASHARYTTFERATPSPAEVIAIHYDSYRNLVAMGVIKAPRIATPFPGQFVPDPR